MGKPVPRCLPCWVVSHLLSVTNPPWLTWTPPLYCPAPLLSWVSTPLSILLTPPPVLWTLILLVRNTTRLLVVYKRSCKITSLFKISSQFWVWMSCQKKTSSLLPVHAKSNVSFPNLSKLLRSSPVTQENSSLWNKLLLDSPKSYQANTITCLR